MDIQDMIRKIGDAVSATATVKSVYGEPVTSGNRTVIPVASIRFAFGGGGGSGAEGDNPKREGGGGGGGGRISAQPCGLVEVTPEGTRYLDFYERERLAAAVVIGFLVGLTVGWAQQRRRRH